MEAARAAEAAVMAGQPLGPLHGVPVAIKDLDDVAGVPTSMGSLAVPESRARKPAQRPSKDYLMRAQSYSARPTARNSVTKELRTTYALVRRARRGRSGTIPAARRVGAPPPWLMAWPLSAQGTDGGGSVRIPASFSGAVGFKPSFGRIPSVTRPDAFLWSHPLVHIGPLTRTVADAALMTSVMAGPHCRRSADASRRRRRLLARGGKHGDEISASPYSPNLGDFPVDDACRERRSIGQTEALARVAVLKSMK